MKCDLQYIRQTADGKHLLRCNVCAREVLARDPNKRRRASCGTAFVVPKDGCGTELAGIIKALRQRTKAGCGCGALRREMNELGIQGCRRERERLAGELRKKAAKVGLTSKAIAAWAVVTSGLAIEIDWLDPCGSMIDLAIRRAEANA